MWARVDDCWWSHPKVALLDNGPAGLWIKALSWSCHQRRDTVPESLLPLFRSNQTEANALQEAGLWDPVEGGWRIHDWADYQEKSVSEKRAEAGRKGGERSGIVRSKSKQTEANVEAGTHPFPSRPSEEVTSSSDRDSDSAQPVDDDPAAAIDALARADLARRESEKGPVGNPDAWLASARAGHRRKADADPDYLTRRPTLAAVPTPLDGTVAASRAVMERNARRNAGQACDDCSDSGHILDASGTARPCHCSSAAS